MLMVDKSPEVWVGGNGHSTVGAHQTVHGGLANLFKLLYTLLSVEKVSSIDVDAYTQEAFTANITIVDPRMVGAVVDNSIETLRWLRERVKVNIMLSFEVDGRMKYLDGMALSAEDSGKGLTESHRKALKKTGVEGWYETRAVVGDAEDGG